MDIPPLIVVISALIVVAFFISPPWSILGKADVIGYAICHRIPERSFILGGRPLPLCARCTGTFLGSLLGFMAISAFGRMKAGKFPPLPILLVLVSFIVLMGIDGINSYLSFFPSLPNLYEPSNFLRLATGTLNGLALSAIVYPIFNFTLWEEVTDVSVIKSFGELVLLLALASVLILVVYAEIGFLLYPLAALSAIGVIVMLTLVNTIIVLIVLRREGVARSFGDAILPLLTGLAVTILEIVGIDIMRFLLTKSLGLPF